jgi:thioredoxin 1
MSKKQVKGLPRQCFAHTPIVSERQARRLIEKESFERPVVVDFFAHWCSHCAETSPEIDDLAGHLCDNAKVVKVDVDAARKLADTLGVSGLPTVAVFKDGKMYRKAEGYQPSPVFLDLLSEPKVAKPRAQRKPRVAAPVAPPEQPAPSGE